MNKKEIFRKIEGIIADLNDQYEYLSQNSESLNELELELFTANAHFLSDHITILKKLNDHSLKTAPVSTESITAQSAKPTEIVQESAQLESISKNEIQAEKEQDSGWRFELEPEPEVMAEFEKKEIGQLADQNLTAIELNKPDNRIEQNADQLHEELKEIPAEPHKPEVIYEPEPVIKEVILSEKTIVIPVEKLADTIDNENSRQTINDLLSAQKSQGTIANEYRQQPIKDLKSVINLNDKLLFVKDLFNGYSLAYSEAIELLNRLDSFQAADDFLRSHYATKNNWSDKQSTVDKFYEILNRRFSK